MVNAAEHPVVQLQFEIGEVDLLDRGVIRLGLPVYLKFQILQSTNPESGVLVAGGAIDVGEAILVHDPVGLLALGRLPRVEDERFLDGHRPG